MFWFVLLLLLVGGGFYLYQKLVTIEREIRAEQAQEKASQQPPVAASAAPAAAPSGASARPGSTAQTEEQDLQAEPAMSLGSEAAAILARVREQPGLVQVDLYPQFPAVDKKQLQKRIRQMADDGLLRRERQPGGSYRLYPV